MPFPSASRFLRLCLAVLHVGGSIVRADPGAPPNNVPLTYDTASQRYVATVLMGPASSVQTVNFSISSGSGYTTVSTTQCSACLGDSTYNPGLSSSYQSVPGSLSSVIGGVNASGGLMRENCGLLQLPGAAPWAWPNQTMIMANTTDASQHLFSPTVGGIMGLGTTVAAGMPLDSVIRHWFTLHPLNSSFAYGMALARPDADQNAVASNDGGMLHMAAVNMSFFNPSDISWSNASSGFIGQGGATSSSASDGSGIGVLASDWIFEIDGWIFDFGGPTNSSSSLVASAACEPLISDIIIPQDDAVSMYKNVEGAQLVPEAIPIQWSIPCTANLTWVVIASSVLITVPSEDLVLNVGDGSCVGTIQGWQDTTETKYLLGSRFMVNAYIIHQVPRNGTSQVGVAPRLPATPVNAENTNKSKSVTGAIAGGVIGGIVVLALVAAVVVLSLRRSRQRDPHPLDTATIQPYITGYDSISSPPSAALASAQSGSTFAEQQKGPRLLHTTLQLPQSPNTAESPHSPERLLPPAYS